MELVSTTKLLPKEAKYIGITSALILLIYSIFVKFLPSLKVVNENYLVNILFIISLILIIGSKSKVEDERGQTIRYYTHSLVSGLFIVLILINELNQRFESYLPHLSGILSLYVIQYSYLYRYSGEWIIKNKGKVFFIYVILTVSLILFYKFLWN